MPDFRTQPSIGQRNDLRWFQRTVSWRRWYLRLSCLAALAAGVLLIGWTAIGDERVYWSAPVSDAHAMFQQDCNQCHVQPGAPLVRLATFSDAHHSVRDQDCQACHAQQSHDHAPRMQKEQVTGCVECHREHVGRERLADVADMHCTQCHADLQVTSGPHAFARQVPSFEQHPEFLPQQPIPEADLWAQRQRIAPLAIEPGPANDPPQEWQDRTRLKFNHAKHLVDVGVLTAVPRAGEEAGHADRKLLACNDCHQADAAGQYMQPINYEQHCAACHKLESSSLMAGGPLPHETPEIVFGLLRDRFMKYAEEHPDLVTGSGDPAPRLPNKQIEPTAKDKWEFVESKMKDVYDGLFTHVQHGCAYCHDWATHEPANSHDLGFTIVPPNIPERWFASSRFDHSRHRELSCVVCHDPDFDRRGEKGHEKSDLHTQLASELSSDILMPKLETCQACHGDRPANGQAIGARARCVDCHDYHAPHAQESGKLNAWAKPSR